jgi:outer membrane lipoprotein LolB
MISLKRCRRFLVPMRRWSRVCLCLVLVISLAACASRPQTRPADAELDRQSRERFLAQQRDWSLRGRVALATEGRAGSGHIEWRQTGEDFDIRLSAPVTGQSWRLRQTDGVAQLEGLEGGTRRGSDAEALLFEHTGWRVPFAALSAWVRAAPAAGQSQVELDARGRPASFVQRGWQVEYRAWDESLEVALPLKIHARSGGASVRLAVDRWGVP